MSLLLIVGTAYVLFLGWFLGCVLSAPHGYGGDERFHYLEEALSKPPSKRGCGAATRSTGSKRAEKIPGVAIGVRHLSMTCWRDASQGRVG